jgi:hypothetical protein
MGIVVVVVASVVQGVAAVGIGVIVVAIGMLQYLVWCSFLASAMR